MTPEILQLLIVLGITMVLFSIDTIPADVVALGALAAVSALKLVPVDHAFAGFGSDAVIMILGLLIMTAALVRTGVVEIFGNWVMKRLGQSHNRLLLLSMLAPGLLSSVMSNTAAAAFFLPMLIGIARQAKINVSKLLMPLAFSAILASSVTLIGTSTNIMVSGLMIQAGMKPLGMFELTPVGLPILILGIIYMLLIGQHLIPVRSDPDDAVQKFRAQTYITEMLILPGSPLVSGSLSELGLGRDFDLTVLSLIRSDGEHLPPAGEMILQEGDTLLVEGTRDHILRINTLKGVAIQANYQFDDPQTKKQDIRLVEAIVLNRSPLVGRTLVGARLRERFGVQALAINRHGETILSKLSQVRIQMGDILLVQGSHSNVAALEAESAFQILGSVDHHQPRTRRAPIAIAIFAAALLLATLEIVSFPVAALLGVLAAFITRCITPEEAYRDVEWRALILIGSMISVGAALEYTGTAKYLALQIVSFTGNTHPAWLLAGFFVLTMLLTQPMSNQAAAAIVLPIAMQTALQLGLNPRSFAVMIAVAASCSYLTPLEPACLMVYGPGRYRFADFIKVGSILTVLIFLLAIWLVPLIWPLQLVG